MEKSNINSIFHFSIQSEKGDWMSWGNLMNVAVGVYTLFQVYTDIQYRRKGLGTRLVKDVLKWADKNEVIIIIDVGPWGSQGLSKEELFTWYTRLGFKFDSKSPKDKIYMTYQGKRKIPST